MKYEIKYRWIINLTGHHVRSLREKEPNFCTLSPVIINVNLGDEKHVFCCDGTYLIDISNWSGIGLKLSEEYDPNPQIKDLVHSKVFDVD